MDGIKIDVTGNIARVTDRPARLTSGMVGLPVTFTFDSHWDGLSKTAVFRAGKTELIAEGLETETTVPWEALDKPNVWLSIGVYGASADGTIVIPTIWANVCLICEGVNPDGDVSTAPTLPVWQRLVNAVGNLLGLTTNSKDNLVEAINEVHNIALAGGIESDPTLSVSGKAADAKVTGDVIQTHANDQKNPHKVTAEQAGARPDTWMPTAEDVGAATPAYVKRANPYNYLDNSDFRNPVNQRGQTSYTGTSYKIDRWASYYSDSQLTINNGYISVRNHGVYQIVPFANKVFSAFACSTSGEIVALTTQNNQGTTTVYLPTGDWVWAALYEGEYTEETIPDYHPKGFAHELLECQRYYVEIDHYALGTGYSGIGNDVTIFLQTPIQMRTVPTIICDGAIRARYGGTEYYTLDSCRIDAFNRGYSATMRLVGQAISGISTFQVVAGYATSKFALSADL